MLGGKKFEGTVDLDFIRCEYKEERKSDLKFVFVHGLCGWGSYDLLDKAVPYFGFFGGSVIRYLNEQGYMCCGASVDPYGSAWDRACELYAQLAGKVVDYGKEHSARAHHPRFGADYSSMPLMDDFEESKLVLIGHSFGGATVRLFSELLINGSAEEQAATDPDDLSDLFKGGHKDKIFSVVTLAAPTNGTTAYEMEDSVLAGLSSVTSGKDLIIPDLLLKLLKHEDKAKESWDYADYDMHIDNSIALNSRISTFPDIYYISYPCSCSIRDISSGHIIPDKNFTTDIFYPTALYMCHYSGKTAAGVEVGEDWQSNDGLVNEISARAPFGAPALDYKEGMELQTGIWYVMPTVTGDHMRIVGGVTKRTTVNIRPFYTHILDWIISLEK